MQRRWDKSKPPLGPFALNKDCPQAQNLVAWYPALGGGKFLPDLAGKYSINSGTAATRGIGPSGEPTLVCPYLGSVNYAIGASPIAAAPLTIAGWAKTSGTDVRSLAALVKFVSNDRHDLYIASGAGKVIAARSVNSAGTVGAATSSVAITDNEPFHVAGVFTSTTLRDIYFDGVNTGTDTTSISPGTLDRGYVGATANSGGVTQPWGGDISEVGFWNIALGLDIIQRLNDPGLRFELWYPLRSRKWFSAGSGSTTYSYSGSGSLTFSGAATTTWTQIYGYAGSGSLAFSGSASTAWTSNWTYTGDGTLTFSGTGTTSYTPAGATTYTYAGSGSLAFSGAATTTWTSIWGYTGSGDLLFSGAGTTSYVPGLVVYGYAGSGSISFSGSATTSGPVIATEQPSGGALHPWLQPPKKRKRKYGDEDHEQEKVSTGEESKPVEVITKPVKPSRKEQVTNKQDEEIESELFILQALENNLEPRLIELAEQYALIREEEELKLLLLAA